VTGSGGAAGGGHTFDHWRKNVRNEASHDLDGETVVILATPVVLAILAAIVAAIPRRDVMRPHRVMQTLTSQDENASPSE